MTETQNARLGNLNYGIVIPNYNHHLVIEQTVATLLAFNLPIIIVDDGSNEQTQTVLRDIDAKYAQVILVRREKNGGKGAAVQTGLAKAVELGWSHVLQVDADGQHDFE